MISKICFDLCLKTPMATSMALNHKGLKEPEQVRIIKNETNLWHPNLHK